MSASSSESSRGDPTGINSKIAALEEEITRLGGKVEAAEAEIALYKQARSRKKALASKMSARSDEEEDILQNLEDFLSLEPAARSQRINELQGTLRELQGTLRELQHKENSLRDEKARLAATPTTGATLGPSGTMYRIRATFTLSSPSHPFRVTLAHTLQTRRIDISGTCTRNGTNVSLDFAALDTARLFGVRRVVLELLKMYCEGDPPTIVTPDYASLEETLLNVSTEPADPVFLAQEWRYRREDDDESPRPSPCKRPREGEQWEDADPEVFPRSPTKKGAFSLSSTGEQRAHILFERAYRSEMLNVLEKAGVDDPEVRKTTLDELCKLTYDLRYHVHQDYDHLRFYFAWRLDREPERGTWGLTLTPKYTVDNFAGDDIPAMLQWTGIEDKDKDTWIRALVVRKYLAYMVRLGKYQPQELVREWREAPVQAE